MIIYKNGKIAEADEYFGIPATKYGVGFFETILYNGAKICHLGKHITRLKNSLEEYGFKFNNIPFEETTYEILEKNNLIGKKSKITISGYEINKEGDTAIDISAYQYYTDINSFRLNIHNRHQISHLNRHKSINWMHPYLALRRAVTGGYDTSLLISAENEIYEAATGAILLKQGDKFFTTPRANRLPSISLDIAKGLLPVEETEIHLADLDSFDNCWLLNSMIGAKPVQCISVFTFEPDYITAKKITDAICN